MRIGNKSRTLRPMLARFAVFLVAALLACGALTGLACSSKLPDPNSPGARTYVKYCSVDGCHDAIPPKQAGRGYWDAKLSSMLGMIQKSGRPMPTPQEIETIRTYLHEHAMRFGG
jgi:hypothetical protein